MAEEKKEEKVVIDKLKPGYEQDVGLPPAELMEPVDFNLLIADILKEEGVEYVFSLTSGFVWPTELAIQHNGIRRVNVRHEQAATFAADAWGRITGRPGVALIGPGTGATNAAAGVAQAYAAQAPMVVIGGTHRQQYDYAFDAQGIVNHEYAYKGMSKYSIRVDSGESIPFEVKRAFRAAMTPPMGPVCVSVPIDVAIGKAKLPRIMYEMQYAPGWAPMEAKTLADPDVVQKAMKWLMEAEKPAIITGEGIHYDHAEEELKEFAELTGIPIHCRRVGRGAISEYHPLNCGGRARGRVMRASDRAMVMGLRVAFLENFGLPPFWGVQTRYIQAQQCRENVNLLLATEFELVGNLKMILRQMIDCVKAMGIEKPLQKWDGWRKFVADTKQEYERRTLERTEKMRGKLPLHPDLFGRLASEFLRDELQDDYIAVIDGFTASSFFTDWHKMRDSARVMDASETIGLGHGMGMAIGAGLATNRSKPIFVVLGDGGIGAGGMDIETAVRWNIPAVFCHENNSTMVCGGWDRFAKNWALKATGNELLDSWQTLPNIRYDRMFAEFGCHAEFVENDEEVKPALKRAFDFVMRESKPAFVEVFVDPDVLQEIWATGLTALCGIVPWEELTEEGRQTILRERLVPPLQFAWVDPSWHGPILEDLMKPKE